MLYNFFVPTQITPQSLYLQKDITQLVEFPDSYGQFQLLTATDNQECSVTRCVVTMNLLELVKVVIQAWHLTLSWSILRPWSSVYGPSSGQRRQNRMSIAPSKNSQPGPSYETYFKCCIPFVSLTVDRAGKNIIVLSTDNNGYDKIPESSITVSSILSEVGRKVSIVTENLVLLDSKCYQLQMIKVNLFTLQVECVCTCVKCNIRWV